jgi:hypothetical protein
VNHENNPFFFWSEAPGEFAAYLGPSDSNGSWGSLGCSDGKRMKPSNRVFIKDYATARRLEDLRVLKPCGNCNKVEFERYVNNGSPPVYRTIEFV